MERRKGRDTTHGTPDNRQSLRIFLRKLCIVDLIMCSVVGGCDRLQRIEHKLLKFFKIS
jgi:hypothetical protein